MNERIKELAKQAGFQYIKDEGIGWAGNHNASLPKFAELIVRECANIVQDSPWQLPQGYKSADQAKLVKKYFGVEE